MDIQIVTEKIQDFGAVHWDGTRKIARDIIEWLKAHYDSEAHRSEFQAEYVENYDGDKLYKRLSCNTYFVNLHPGNWLVLSKEEGFRVYRDDDFNKKFVVKRHGTQLRAKFSSFTPGA